MNQKVIYPLIECLSRTEKIALADSLIGKQLWATNWWRGNDWAELPLPQPRNVQYVMLHKDGRILLAFHDGVVPLTAYGNDLFLTKDRACGELAYRNRDREKG